MSEWVPTTCMRCAVGCGHRQREVDVGAGIDTVRGDADHPVSQGLACERGIEESADPDGEWLTAPLVREDGELRETTWDVALSRAVAGLREAADPNPNEVAILGSGQQTNEAAYLLGKVARGGFGTRAYDANTTLCMASAVTAYYESFGSDAPPCTYADIDDADSHVVWGANPAVAHPVLFRWLRRAADEAGVELVVVDPVRSATAEAADHHVAPDPGMDLRLARAVLSRLVATDRIDRAFVDAATEGFEDLRASLPDAETAAADAGVAAADLDRLAAAFDRRTLVYWGMGINQHVQGTDTARALIDLTLATGNVRPGAGPFSLTGQANSMGTRICSSKGTWPGQRPFSDPNHRRTIADHWGIPVDRLPDDPGPGPVGVLAGRPTAVWTVATNPAAGMPDADTARERLSETFLVAQDAFHTETTALADVVLPAATWGESEGTATNMERTVSRIRAATDPPGGVRTDLELIATVGASLFPDLIDERSPDPASTFAEFAALTAGTVADCSGITYDRLDDALAVRWPAPDAESAGGYRYHDDGSWSFPTPTGRAQFSTAGQEPLPEPTDGAYPLTLTTARAADGYNTGVRSRGGEAGPLTARLHPDTVADHAAGVEAGRLAVESRRGSVTVTIDRDEGVPEGMVWLPIHHPATNRLTLPDTDPRSDEPHFKQCAVRLVAPSSTSEAEAAAADGTAPRADD